MSLTTSRHIYSSRGRTRQPKNLALEFHEGTTAEPNPQAHFKASGSVTTLAASSSLSDTLAGTAAGTNGYDTQNQDYLHLALSQSDGNTRSVSVYAYNRCFGAWGLLKVPVSNAATLDAMYVDATIVSDTNSVKYATIPIHGIDRVAFVAADSGSLTVYAAASTL